MMDEAMDHPRIDEERILDRYLSGRLSEADAALFEEHLFACSACLEQAEAGEALRRGLQAVAAEDATRAAVAQQVIGVGLMAWLRTRSPVYRASFAALALAAVLLPVALVWQQGALRQARAEARAEARQATELAAQGSPGKTGFAEPLGAFQVVSLGVVRDGDAVPVAIRPDPSKQAVLLSLELSDGVAARYRVTLRDGMGEALWRGDDLEPNLYETLLVALPSSYLKPGDYRITVEALSGSGEAGAEPAEELAFRVLPGG
jgi:hypothetical protein